MSIDALHVPTRAGEIAAAGRRDLGRRIGVLERSEHIGPGSVKAIHLHSAFVLPTTGLPAHAGTHRPNTGTDPLATASAVGLSQSSVSAAGTSDSFARADHTHAVDFTPFAPKESPTFTGAVVVTGATAPRHGATTASSDASDKIPTTQWTQDKIIAWFGGPPPAWSPVVPAPPTEEDSLRIAPTAWVRTRVAVAVAAEEARAELAYAKIPADNVMTGKNTVQRATAPEVAIQARVGAEANPRFQVTAGGTISLGPGGATAPTPLAASNLSNGVTGSGAVALAGSPTFTGTLSAGLVSLTNTISGTGVLMTGNLKTTGGFLNIDRAAGAAAIWLNRTGEGSYRLHADVDGKITWGDGTVGDTTLYRVQANALGTDDSVHMVGGAVICFHAGTTSGELLGQLDGGTAS